jgi:hypothetical protein
MASAFAAILRIKAPPGAGILLAGRRRSDYCFAMRTAILAVLVLSMAPLPEKVSVADSELYRLRYGDSVTENDRCPVRKSRLNRRMPAVWVNGKPIGFC